MSALTKFEAFVENLLEGSLTRLLRGQLQPVEIAKRLARVMENSKAISVGRVFVANEYHVYLSIRDYQRLEPVRATMENELADYLVGVAREQRLTLVSKPSVKLQSSPNLPPRQVRVEARLVDQPSATMPGNEEQLPFDVGQTRRFDADQVRRSLRNATDRASLVATSGSADGIRYPIEKATTTIGRGLANDVIVDDPSVSRHHAEIRMTGGKIYIFDLKSTNGTWVNGYKVTERILSEGDRIAIGGQEFLFQMEPEN